MDDWELVKRDASTQTESRSTSDLLTEANFNLRNALDLLLSLTEQEGLGPNPN